MIYLDELKVKEKTFYKIDYIEGEEVKESYVYHSRSEAEAFAPKLANKRNCEVVSSLPKKSKKSKS